MINVIKKLDPKNTFKLTRAFSHFMNFINLAELVDASRSLNKYENNKKKLNKQNLFIEEIFEDLFNKDISKNKIYNLAKNLNIGIVLGSVEFQSGAIPFWNSFQLIIFRLVFTFQVL